MFFPAHLLVSGRRALLRHISRLICLGVLALKTVDLAAAPAPPVQPVPEGALLALAQKKFGALSRAEEELFRAAQEGRFASALTGHDEADKPANAADWPKDRAVRAACIAWICTDPQASALVTYRGLQFYGMRIDGALDLEDAGIKFPFLAWKCVFSDKISLEHAQTRGFYLLECTISRLHAAGAIIKGSVLLRPVKAEGEVNLVGARIDGNLECDGSQLSNPEGFALLANGAEIKGHVFLRKGFKAEGEVNFVGATVGGELDCSRGQFCNPKGLALNADSARIERIASLRDHFLAKGGVKLTGATIGMLVIRDVLEADQAILDLGLTKVETFWDDEASWPNAEDLFLDGFRYERLVESAPFEAARRNRWLSLQPRDKFRPQPYEQLAAVLRQMGHERDARDVMIEKNRERARFTHFPQQGWWWYNFFGRLIGYGYEPWRAFLASLAMILLGALLFRLGSKHNLIGPTSDNAYAKAPAGQVIEENGRPKISEKYPVFNAFVYSLESFIPLLKLDQSAHWRPNANHGAEIPLFILWAPRTGELLRSYLYLHIAAGWLLTSLWVGAITGLVKT